MTGVHLHRPASLLEVEVVHRVRLNPEGDGVSLKAETLATDQSYVGSRKLVLKHEHSILDRHLDVLAKTYWLQCDCDDGAVSKTLDTPGHGDIGPFTGQLVLVGLNHREPGGGEGHGGGHWGELEAAGVGDVTGGAVPWLFSSWEL